MSVTVTGLDELDATIAAMDPANLDKAVRKALRAGGEVIRAAIEEAAPERTDAWTTTSTALPPGALKGDIIMKVKTDGKGVGVAFIMPGKYTLHVARWVEYGHALVRDGYSRLTKSGGRRGPGKLVGNVPAHPFIRPAYEAVQQEAQRVGVATLIQEVMKIARQTLKKTA